jgi:YHS domain-containing protein
MHTQFFQTIATVFLVASAIALAALANPISTTANIDRNGIILDGFDVVSYFTEKSPIKGSDKFIVELEGIKYKFASEKNMNEFKANPEKYKPAYEGWCATGVLKNKKIEINPKNYKITNGRLFLFYELFGGLQDAKDDWVDHAKKNQKESESIIKADNNWPMVKNQRPE